MNILRGMTYSLIFIDEDLVDPPSLDHRIVALPEWVSMGVGLRLLLAEELR